VSRTNLLIRSIFVARSGHIFAALVVLAIMSLLVACGGTTTIVLSPPEQPTTGSTTGPTIPYIAGNYQGSFTYDGQSGNSPMQIQIFQAGTQLTGTTTEGSSSASDTGTISSSGQFSITETFSGGGTATLDGSITGSGQLSGTWTNGSQGGSWTVSRV
jgi:hypothetical protein